ncbi:hypothetical protein PBI_BUTTERS_31 [Mycobacterium phage Butters]|uniref:Uncharacterized protein n=2 Tax=Charlievirus butters TaxID=2169798 RepID=A0A2Z5HEP1_9CAUD|nr:hypothetical protein K768_gp31 [Mycobacterium phage Butters]AGI12978.1 hypothetical protein PBI_BUTTERS_31 [Mycobacterium phage Butters]AXC38494.1 hypothetical protein SEA_RUBEELU_31 [Mycobacterium phage Rubeelu]
MDRFNIVPLIRGQIKGLTLGTRPGQRDYVALTILFGIPGLLLLAAIKWNWSLIAPIPLLTAVALLAGGTLSAFGSLSTLRLKLTEWSESHDGKDVYRDSLDESVAHLFMIALACVADAATLVVGLNVTRGQPGTPLQDAVTCAPAYIAIAITAYIFLAFIMVLPRLYWAYVKMNRVSPQLNGFDATK